MLGASAPPRSTHLQRWPRAIAQYVVGHGERAQHIAHHLQRLGIWLTGTSLHGVGVNDVIRDAARVVDGLVPG